MILIQTLHDIQSLLCRISIFPICLSLQCGQVIQTRCKGFFLFAGYGSYFQRLISENIGNLLCPFFIKSSEALTLWFLPCPGDITCFQGDSVIFLRLKCPYLFFPFRNHRQCRSLYTPAGKLGIIFTGKCPCTVHSHQPVSFRSCHSCSVQIIIFMSVFQISESFFDSFVCNRRNPQSADWFMTVRFVKNPAGYQFTFSSGICGYYNIVYVFSVQLRFYCIVLFTGLSNNYQLHSVRQHGKC